MEIIRDSLNEVAVVGRSTDQDSDQDKNQIDRIISVIG